MQCKVSGEWPRIVSHCVVNNIQFVLSEFNIKPVIQFLFVECIPCLYSVMKLPSFRRFHSSYLNTDLLYYYLLGT